LCFYTIKIILYLLFLIILIIKNNLLKVNNEFAKNSTMSGLQSIVLSQCPGDEVVEPINIQNPDKTIC
jgi:hypothetical protein